MPMIRTVVTENAPYRVNQRDLVGVVRNLFGGEYEDIERLLKVFGNGQIDSRYFAAPLDWFEKDRTLEEKNNLYIEEAVRMGSRAVQKCLAEAEVDATEIDAIIFISSSGLSTPTIDARIMNELNMPPNIKRMPLWGLGCAGGAAGLSRADDYCRAYPGANVLVLCLELCSLTFVRGDKSKSNLIGTSLFSDGAACVLVAGDKAADDDGFRIHANRSALMPQSEDVMGWDVRDAGLHVVFSRSIPSIIEKWLKPNVNEFLAALGKSTDDIQHFIAHPGGKKVLTAYEKSLEMPASQTAISRQVLSEYGNMSSPTVLYVLKEFMDRPMKTGEEALLTALGPGFSSEMLWLEWVGEA
ncbi:3-oxoacyl-[acyl-carrier-protein] synthase III C-terminal domain-containing protein [Planococcus sp. ISL-109]|uniref:type III polyketide synthase n=1 Tax=Planococcus sp. ISL-109 TaxID=2819166 RepID=UPI001BECE558|nr:3-oxoacyl-[acyl-carrier-protein] synthase III C-terminal domain-containing protein [Planococcus sp. ISL-109]MBT2581392.1 type III polyketide synthase [Planococcus sp. ISL-109]